MTSWREGLTVGGFAPDVFPKLGGALLLAALAIKLAALYLSRKVSLPRPAGWFGAAICLAGFIGVYAVANQLDPLHYIQTTRGVGRLGHIRGYLGPWFAEWYYLRQDQLLQEVLDRRQKIYDRITPIEAEIPIHKRLVIVQAESLDTNVLGYKVNGVRRDAVLESASQRVDVFPRASVTRLRISQCRLRLAHRSARLTAGQHLRNSGLSV